MSELFPPHENNTLLHEESHRFPDQDMEESERESPPGDPPEGAQPHTVSEKAPTQQNLNTDPGKTNTKKPEKRATYAFLQAENYPQRYYLELYESPESKEPLAAVQLPFVSGIEMSQPLSVQRTWTLGGVYEEHSGFQQRSFRIKGRSGWSPLQLTRFAKLRNFIEKYATLSAENKNAFVRAKDIRLAINFPWEGEAFWATLVEFKYTRDVGSTRVSFAYEVDLLTNGVASQRWDAENGLSYLNCDTGDGCHIDPTHYCAKRAEEIVLTVPPEYAKDLPQGFFNVMAELRRKVPLRVLMTNPGYVRRVHALCLRAAFELAVNLRAMLEPKRSGFRPYAEGVMRWIVDLRMQCELQLGGLLLRVDLQVVVEFNKSIGGGSRTSTQPIPSRGRPVIAVTVAGADTAHDIAHHHLGNRNAWQKVVEINGMRDVRTKRDGSPLVPGDVLLVPSEGGLEDIDPDSFYGIGFKVVEGDLVSVADRDIGLVSGLENFFQNFSSRMRTTRGSNKTYSDFGLRRVTGTTSDSDMPAILMSEVQRQTLSDHRVREVSEMQLGELPEGYDIELSITTALQDKRKTKFSYTT